jgi:hypothetical protein
MKLWGNLYCPFPDSNLPEFKASLSHPTSEYVSQFSGTKREAFQRWRPLQERKLPYLQEQLNPTGFIYVSERRASTGCQDESGNRVDIVASRVSAKFALLRIYPLSHDIFYLFVMPHASYFSAVPFVRPILGISPFATEEGSQC